VIRGDLSSFSGDLSRDRLKARSHGRSADDRVVGVERRGSSLGELAGLSKDLTCD
jgi:hypothetical protein